MAVFLHLTSSKRVFAGLPIRHNAFNFLLLFYVLLQVINLSEIRVKKAVFILYFFTFSLFFYRTIFFQEDQLESTKT